MDSIERSGLSPDEELEYLRQVELLAADVVARAYDDSVVELGPDPADATGLQRAVNALARTLRDYHFDGDGCVEDDPDFLSLSGVVVIGPEAMPAEWDISYERLCERLGVEPRPAGWALWHTWDDEGKRPHTLVTSSLATTAGLLRNWAQGRNMAPVRPERAQISAVVRGWIGPAVVSPWWAEESGLGGRKSPQ